MNFTTITTSFNAPVHVWGAAGYRPKNNTRVLIPAFIPVSDLIKFVRKAHSFILVGQSIENPKEFYQDEFLTSELFHT